MKFGIGNPAKDFMEMLAKLEPVEIIGVGKLLEVDGELVKHTLMKNDYEDLVVDMTRRFLEKNRGSRRKIMKFLKEIEKESRIEDKEEENKTEEISTEEN